MPVRYGTDDDDDLDLGSGTWIAYGLGGDDVIRSYGFLDTDTGNIFLPVIYRYSGDDLLFGMDGDDVIGSGEGADELRGGNHNDLLDASIGDDEVYGESGDDVLIFGFGNDLYNGGSGYDILDASLLGALGAPTGLIEISDGGEREKALYVDQDAGIELNLRTGNAWLRDRDGVRGQFMGGSSFSAVEEIQLTGFRDLLTDDDGSHTILAGGGADRVFGGGGDDVMFGATGDDRLQGEGGDDLLFGQANNDVLDGGDGFDTLEGDSGTDNLFGGIGNDILVGGSGADLLDGEDGVDIADYRLSTAAVTVSLQDYGIGGSGSGGDAAGDRLFGIENVIGSAFADTLIGDGGVNTLEGLDGNDTLSGGDERDTLIGGAGNDTLNGGAGNDSLNGGDGTDTLNGGTGADTMAGGAGNDTYLVDNAGDVLIESASSTGTDTVQTGISFTLASGASIEIFTTTNAAATASLNLTGNAFDNQITGNDGRNTLDGGAGDDTLDGRDGADTLQGGSGDDTLDGGAGIDVMSGGTGDDVHVVDNVDDSVFESFGQGTQDGIFTSVSYALGKGSEIEFLQAQGAFTSTAPLNLTGNESAQSLIGNQGSNNLSGQGDDDDLIGLGAFDQLFGGDGNDRLFGGEAGDDLTGGTGTDLFVYTALSDSGLVLGAFDLIRDFNPFELDTIDLSQIDANAQVGGDQAFSFIGAATFNAPGQIRFFTNGLGTLLDINTDGDSDSEMLIRLVGVPTPDASWFVL